MASFLSLAGQLGFGSLAANAARPLPRQQQRPQQRPSHLTLLRPPLKGPQQPPYWLGGNDPAYNGKPYGVRNWGNYENAIPDYLKDVKTIDRLAYKFENAADTGRLAKLTPEEFDLLYWANSNEKFISKPDKGLKSIYDQKIGKEGYKLKLQPKANADAAKEAAVGVKRDPCKAAPGETRNFKDCFDKLKDVSDREKLLNSKLATCQEKLERLCLYVCCCAEHPLEKSKRMLRQKCVEDNMLKNNTEKQGLIPEVPYDIRSEADQDAGKKPIPIMDHNNRYVNRNILYHGYTSWNTIRRMTEEEIEQAYRYPKGRVKIPDVVMVKDPQKPPTQDNIDMVADVKFWYGKNSYDTMSKEQQDAYTKIAGSLKKVLVVIPGGHSRPRNILEMINPRFTNASASSVWTN